MVVHHEVITRDGRETNRSKFVNNDHASRSESEFSQAMRTFPSTIVAGWVGCMLLLAGTVHAGQAVSGEPRQAEAAPVMAAPVRLFQKYLSGADGHRCPMRPSCSGYALQAIQRHGSVLGWVMTCDRLMRCGRDELKRSPPVKTPHGVRIHDPLDNNDFWLR